MRVTATRTVVAAIVSFAAVSLAQPRPPAEALAACNGLADGTACGFTINGKNLTGTCRSGPNGEQAACFPAGGPGGPGGPGGHHRGPPPEATAACANQTAGATCSFSHHDRTVSGTCKAPPDNASGALACAPEFGAGGPGGPGGHRGPPPEAITACASLASGAACNVTFPDGKSVSGTCESHGSALACRPAHPPPPPPSSN
ncbi:MAG: hypothetical protein QM817_37530 [Archangium sp.]